MCSFFLQDSFLSVVVVIITLSAIRQTFSRESSCSSEGSAMRLSETVARNKALFENNGMSSNTTPAAAQKWPGNNKFGLAPIHTISSIDTLKSSGVVILKIIYLSEVVFTFNSEVE